MLQAASVAPQGTHLCLLNNMPETLVPKDNSANEARKCYLTALDNYYYYTSLAWP